MGVATGRGWSRVGRPLFFAVTTVVLTLALLEIALVAMLSVPVRGAPWLPVARDLYLNVTRDIIQFNAQAARWDPELFYTLRPGRFQFLQAEFRHEFRVNGAGLRDEESALRAPEIIVVGDSFTMGWGVAQEAAYPKLIEAAIGRRTLNAGVSSYGTVREMLLLNRLDMSRLRVLVVQYNGDDFFENRAYWRAGNEHRSRDERRWRYTVERVAARRAYSPGKHVWDVGRRLVRRLALRSRTTEAPAEPDAVELFLNALTHAPRVDLSRVQLVVWEMPGSGVIPHLPERLRRGDYPAPVRTMVLVDVAPAVDAARDFWILDDHLNASGHRAVAGRLIDALQRLDRAR